MVRIHVTAYGDLRRYLPAEQHDSGAALVLPDGATITQMLDALRLPYQNTWLIGVNDSVVELDHPLHDGDRVELMMPIGGGTDTSVLAVDVRFVDDAMQVRLSDSREVTVPLEWFLRLRDATAEQRAHWRLIGRGIGIHWEDVDEDILVASLLRI